MALSTRKLFHQDAYQTRFTARVLSSLPNGENWAVVLDSTCFYAEAGGQPSDVGTLGERRVLDVQERDDGTVVHTVDGPLDGEVVGDVDWGRRLDHMEQHTAQHLLSGAFERLLDSETVSWHLGSTDTSVDLDIAALDADQIDRIEAECNRIIRGCLPVVTHLVDQAGTAMLPLRKPPKVTEEIRVVEIERYDWSACAGTHVRNTGELGLLKVKSWERYKKGTRILFLAGRRAMADYMALDQITRTLCRSLSIGVRNLSGYIDRTQEEISTLRKQVKVLQEQVLETEAAQLVAAAKATGLARTVIRVWEGRPLDELRLLAAKVAAHPRALAVFGMAGAVPQIILHRSVDLSVDMGGLIRTVLPLLEGRGGGSPIQAQAGGSRPMGLAPAMAQIATRLEEMLD